MVYKLHGTWYEAMVSIEGESYDCGFCDTRVGPVKGFECGLGVGLAHASIYICPNCNQPTYESFNRIQIPGVKPGKDVESLPSDIDSLYDEARKCFSVGAYTSAVLSCRKLLMNIAVSNGADEGKSFAHYVNYLVENNHSPPNSKNWVDHIRKIGNIATHELPSITKKDASELLVFIEMLLTFIYEMPGRMEEYISEQCFKHLFDVHPQSQTTNLILGLFCTAKIECVICEMEIDKMDIFNGEPVCQKYYHDPVNKVFGMSTLNQTNI